VSDAQHFHPLDEIAVYALDGLEPDEQATIEAHLAECPVCQAELEGHLATLARLTPDEPASRAIWARIADAIAAEAAETGAARPPLEAVPRPQAPRPGAAPRRPVRRQPPGAPGERPRHLAERRRPWQTWVGQAAAAVILVAAALGVGYVLGDRGEEEPDLNEVAEEARNEPGASVVTLVTADGAPVAEVVVTAEGSGFFFTEDLPALPAGRVYQLWQLDGPQPVSLGPVGDGTTPIIAVAIPPGTTTMAISSEVAGGVVAPTPDQIVAQGEATG
jgi:hypothetical protein